MACEDAYHDPEPFLSFQSLDLVQGLGPAYMRNLCTLRVALADRISLRDCWPTLRSNKVVLRTYHLGQPKQCSKHRTAFRATELSLTVVDAEQMPAAK